MPHNFVQFFFLCHAECRWFFFCFCAGGDLFVLLWPGGDSVLVLKVTDGWETIAKCEVHRVQYWTWLTYSVLALITDRCVYHWNIDQGTYIQTIFTSFIMFKSGKMSRVCVLFFC